eukprot:388586-Rhodomonas_salina.1
MSGTRITAVKRAAGPPKTRARSAAISSALTTHGVQAAIASVLTHGVQAAVKRAAHGFLEKMIQEHEAKKRDDSVLDSAVDMHNG